MLWCLKMERVKAGDAAYKQTYGPKAELVQVWRDSSLKSEMSPVYSSLRCQWRLQRYFLIQVTIVEFHRGEQFHPVTTDQKHTTSPDSSSGIVEVFRRLGHPICLELATLYHVFNQSIHCSDRKFSNLAYMPLELAIRARASSMQLLARKLQRIFWLKKWHRRFETSYTVGSTGHLHVTMQAVWRRYSFFILCWRPWPH